jgi:uncharacterized protein YecE (DUF72 family)
MAGRIVVGTSSWADPGFVAKWYPKGMAARDRLRWYAERFDAVEVNSSYYAIPDRGTVERWVGETPDGFSFDVKVHRLLSRHAATLDSLPPDLRPEAETNPRGRVLLTSEIEQAMAMRLLEAVEPLVAAGRLSSFLCQLTPAFAPAKSELAELDPLIEALNPHRLAIEFRHRGWVEGDRAEETLSFLSERDVAFVCVDAPQEVHVPIMPAIDAVTRDDLAYVRAHGRNAEGYMSGKTVAERFGWVYSDDELEEIAGRAKELASQADEVRVMFNNNRDDDAPTAARRLRQLLGQDPGPPPGDPAQQLL